VWERMRLGAGASEAASWRLVLLNQSTAKKLPIQRVRFHVVRHLAGQTKIGGGRHGDHGRQRPPRHNSSSVQHQRPPMTSTHSTDIEKEGVDTETTKDKGNEERQREEQWDGRPRQAAERAHTHTHTHTQTNKESIRSWRSRERRKDGHQTQRL
jgi:hypothetical protein